MALHDHNSGNLDVKSSCTGRISVRDGTDTQGSQRNPQDRTFAELLIDLRGGSVAPGGAGPDVAGGRSLTEWPVLYSEPTYRKVA
jgi:hypothetical protein